LNEPPEFLESETLLLGETPLNVTVTGVAVATAARERAATAETARERERMARNSVLVGEYIRPGWQ
jgi:hypothetical protein